MLGFSPPSLLSWEVLLSLLACLLDVDVVEEELEAVAGTAELVVELSESALPALSDTERTVRQDLTLAGLTFWRVEERLDLATL